MQFLYIKQTQKKHKVAGKMKQMKFRNANMFGKVGANLSRIPHRALESYPMKWLEHIFQRRARNQVVSSPRASVRRSPPSPELLTCFTQSSMLHDFLHTSSLRTSSLALRLRVSKSVLDLPFDRPSSSSSSSSSCDASSCSTTIIESCHAGVAFE